MDSAVRRGNRAGQPSVPGRPTNFDNRRAKQAQREITSQTD